MAPSPRAPAAAKRRPAPERRRRTQQERSAQTQGRVLDAALECLAREGYRATTTLAVAERAGVSRGAQLHHFPTRAALVSAALRRLYAELTAEYEKGFASLAPGADRLDAAVELLWRVMCDPRLDAATELTVAARTDAELRREVAAVARAHRRGIGRLARAYFPESAAAPDFDARLDLVIDALQGLVLRCGLHGEGPELGHSLALVKEVAARAVGAGRRRRGA
jgi:AcrR family transcriptional regulator